MKKIVKILPIPDGVFGYLNVLPNVEVWTLDHFTWDWLPALRVFPKRPTSVIEVCQYALASPFELCKKDYINEAMILSGYYVVLTRGNGCFGIAYAERDFFHPKQDFIK